MKELSIFIDESGDFGEVKEHPAYYLVTFVFHNQDNNIVTRSAWNKLVSGYYYL